MICVWAAPPTCMSRGLRAYQGVYAHTQGLTCERTMWLSGRYHPGQAPDNVREQPIPPGTAQNAGYFATSSPFLTFFTEVFCGLGAIPPRTAAAPPPVGGNCTTRGSVITHREGSHGRQTGELHYTGVRHAGDTPPEGFAWRKTPITTPTRGAGASTTAKLRHERTASRHDIRSESQV